MTQYELESVISADAWTVGIEPHWITPEDEARGRKHAWRIALTLGNEKCKIYLVSTRECPIDGFSSDWSSDVDQVCLWNQADKSAASRILQALYEHWDRMPGSEPEAAPVLSSGG